MKKNKLFFSLFALLIAISASFFINFSSNNNCVYANSTIGPQEITDFSQISNLNGNYCLKGNINLEDFSGVAGTFTGSLNGNGYSVTGSMTAPLFNSLGSGANIQNISFSNLEYKIQENSNIEEQNIGLVAGSCVGATVSQIKVLNVAIKTDVVESQIEGVQTKYHTLATNTNLGIIAGKAVDGSTIQNSSIENVQFNILIGNCVAQSFNFGGVAGVLSGGKLANNIVNINSANAQAIKFSSDVLKTVVFGGLVGLSDSDKNYIYNNILILDVPNIAFSDALTSNHIGAIAGKLVIEPYLSNIEGFVTNFTGEYFGIKSTNKYTYSKLTKLPYEEIGSAIFSNSSLWNDLDQNKWDYNRIWMNLSGSKFPILQCYQTYSILFDTEESSKSLNLEVMPEGAVVSGAVGINGVEGENGTKLENIPYDSNVYIKVDILNTNYYNNFFYISGLQLNGKTIYDNVNNIKDPNINISVLEPLNGEGERNSYTYVISGFTANCAGTYNVLLGRNTYKLNVKVLNIGTEETGSIIPGKFKTNLNTNHVTQTVLDLEYGEKYILNTVITDTDYSDRANWFVYKNTAEEVEEGVFEFADVNFENVEENANFSGSKLEFTFNESCSLFAPAEPNNNTKYFNFEEYNEFEINEELTSVFDLYIVYNKRVKEVKITFKYDNDEIINENIAKLLIDNKSDRLTWNEQEGVYYAKVAFVRGSDTDYTIRIDQLSTEYEFDDWYIGMEKLTDVDDNDLAGVFTVNEATEEPIEIFCVFKYDAETTNDLLWLWITLGVVGVVGLIVLIIFLIKRRKGGGGGSSYKKYYY